MTDDQGYGVPGTFGGVIPTPALDRIAKAGLRYTQFHSTALCSPTRIWLGQYKKWSSGKMRVGYGLSLLGLLGVLVVFVTGLGGIGRGKPVFLYNLLDLERFKWEGSSLSAGKHTIVFSFKYDGPGPGKGGTGVLTVDGKEVDRKTIPHTIPLLMSIDETFDIGSDTRTGVDDFAYQVPFHFTGTINKLNYKLGPEQLTAEDKATAAKILAAAKD